MLDACWLHRLLAWGRSQALLGHFQFASLPRMSANCNARTKLDRFVVCHTFQYNNVQAGSLPAIVPIKKDNQLTGVQSSRNAIVEGC